MNKIYCANTSCAKVNTYEAIKPKFCSHCGQPFSGGFSFSVAQSQTPTPVLGVRQNTLPRPESKSIVIDDSEELDFSAFKFGVKEMGRKVTLGDIQKGNAFVADSDRPAGNETDVEQVQKNNIRRFKNQSEPTEVQ